MANKTVVQAGQQAAGLDPFALMGIAGVTLAAGTGAYLYFSDREYALMTRASHFIGKKVRGETEDREIDKEELQEEAEEVIEQEDLNTSSEELLNTVEAIAENKEYLGRQEERKKQREDDNIKDLLTIVLLTSGANLLLRLWEMFA